VLEPKSHAIAWSTSGRRWTAFHSASVIPGKRRSGQFSFVGLQLLKPGFERRTWKVDVPNSSMSCWNDWRMPCTVAPIATTTNTPTATPEMVRAARTLLARSESRAMYAPSRVMRILSQRRIAHSCRNAAIGSRRDARLAG
jgi:hypothetical protein